MIKSILQNKIIFYLFSRYGTYALQFIVSMVIAAKLGPYYLGIYGFLTLILNYFSQINFGIPHSLNVLMVHNKKNVNKCNNYIGNSFAIYGLISIIIICVLFFILLSKITLSDKYPISVFHCILLCIIAILQYYSTLCSTILRVKNKVNQLALAQSSLVLLNFSVIFFFNGEYLIYILMICQILSFGIFIGLTLKEGLIPNLKLLEYKYDIQKDIIKKGLYLFLYNSCFYFILISIRTIISSNYSIEEFGIFNFSFTLSHAVLLLIEALTVILFPKIIDLLSSDNYEKINSTIETIRVSFVSTSHLLIYTAILFFPLITMIMPEFDGALTSLNLIALAVLMNTNSYGYSSFLIAQNKEKISARISFIALIINVIIAEIMVSIWNVEFSYVVLAVMITYFCFSFMVFVESKKIIGSLNWNKIIKNFFPLKLFIPYIAALIISLLKFQYLMFVPIVTFIVLNYSDINRIVKIGNQLIKNPNIADV